MHERIALLGDLSWTQRLQELARLAPSRRSYEPFALSKLSEIGSVSRVARTEDLPFRRLPNGAELRAQWRRTSGPGQT